jgi:hypothetical protein
VITRNSHIDSIISERCFRGLTFFFLLLICVDIVFPPQCCESMECVAVRTNLSVSELNIAAAGHPQDLVASDDCQLANTPEEKRCDEDCCFSCAHMLPPMASTDIAVLDVKSSHDISTDQAVTDPSLQGPDHPPRFI